MESVLDRTVGSEIGEDRPIVPMTSDRRSEMHRALSELERGTSEVSALEAERRMMDVLEALLSEEGYTVAHAGGPGDGGVDFVGEHDAGRMGIEFKYSRGEKKVSTAAIRSALGAAVVSNLDRFALLTNGRYSRPARELAQRSLPVQLELLDFDDLRAWIDRLEVHDEKPELVAEARLVMSAMSRRFCIYDRA